MSYQNTPVARAQRGEEVVFRFFPTFDKDDWDDDDRVATMFADEVEAILTNDSSNWTKEYPSLHFERAGKKGWGACTITLVSSATAMRQCHMAGLSCYDPSSENIYINADNWTCVSSACANARSSMANYRRYVILHEVGHALGFAHTTCNEVGGTGPVPIMSQQTKGIGTCDPNHAPIRRLEEQALPKKLIELMSAVDKVPSN